MAAALKKRSGAPDVKYYEQSDTIGQFEPIRLWLMQNYDQYTQADPPSNKALAALTCSLLQFQDEVFGQHSKNRPLTKLPVRYNNISITTYIYYIRLNYSMITVREELYVIS